MGSERKRLEKLLAEASSESEMKAIGAMLDSLVSFEMKRDSKKS